MRIRKYGPAATSGGTPVTVGVYQHPLVNQQLSIAAAAPNTVLWSSRTPPSSVYALMRNSSSAGQIIRVGGAPGFAAPVAGLPLMPGDTLEVTGIVPAWFAIANAAAAVLDIEAYAS